MSEGDYVELYGIDHYVLVRSSRHLDRWLERGFVRVPDEGLFFAVSSAFPGLTAAASYAEVWRRLFPQNPLLPWWIPNDVVWELARAARGPMPRLYVLERVIERGRRYAPLKFEPPPLPSRTETEHYVVIEAVSDAEPATPIAGLRLEVLIADGEIRSAQADANGVARVERIQAGQVVIRVLDVDGASWCVLEGAASQPSGAHQGLRWHTVQQGECLSQIAHRHGLPSWKRVWEHPKNEPLRKRRKSPHVLLPSDQVAVPSIDVYEFVRPTDATHRIQVKAAPKTWVRLKLLDKQRKPVAQGSYEIWVRGERQAEGRMEDGAIECALPLRAQQVELVVRVGNRVVRRPLHIGALDPLDEISGLQGRLSNLGYYAGEVDGEDGESHALAMREFRDAAALGPDDQDDTVLQTLEREHLV